jgi:hypothetical protein
MDKSMVSGEDFPLNQSIELCKTWHKHGKTTGFFRLPIGDQDGGEIEIGLNSESEFSLPSLSAVADVVLPWPMKVINLLIWLVNPTLYGL